MNMSYGYSITQFSTRNERKNLQCRRGGSWGGGYGSLLTELSVRGRVSRLSLSSDYQLFLTTTRPRGWEGGANLLFGIILHANEKTIGFRVSSSSPIHHFASGCKKIAASPSSNSTEKLYL